jgi:hypothetical protein
MIQIIKWLGTLTSIIGSFVVAMQIFLPGYILFLVGSVSWLVVAKITKDRALALLNFVFMCANILGLAKALS